MKKIVFSLLLAAALTLGAASPAFAARVSLDHYYGVADIVASPFGVYEGDAGVSPETTKPGSEIIIPILSYQRDSFKNSDGETIIFKEIDMSASGQEPMRLGPKVSELKANGVVPRIHVLDGENIIRDYEFVEYTPSRAVQAQAALRIRFVEDFVSTSEQNYRFKIYLVFKGKALDFNETFAGMIKNTEIDLYKDDYVNLEHGDIGHAYFDTDEVGVHLGNGTYLFSDMHYNQKYYGVAKHAENEGQTYILRWYPDITETYELKTVNLKTHGDLVEFTRYEEDPHYVYNLRGQYIGMTDDRLPYSTRYYLSPTFIEIDVTEENLYNDIWTQYPPEVPSVAVERFAKGLAESVASGDNAPADGFTPAPGADDDLMDTQDLID